jgi:hypothetical protein
MTPTKHNIYDLLIILALCGTIIWGTYNVVNAQIWYCYYDVPPKGFYQLGGRVIDIQCDENLNFTNYNLTMCFYDDTQKTFKK